MKGSSSPAGVIIVAYGPAGVTKAAIKRARQLGPAGLAVVNAGAVEVSRFSARVDLIATQSGVPGIVEAIEGLDVASVLVLHDDAAVDARTLEWAVEIDGIGVATTEDGRPGGCVAGPATAVCDAFVAHGPDGWHVSDAPAAALPVRHDGRCLEAGGAVRIAASLIVRDEESMLGDCLTSLVGVVDEIVVCDTGSIDRTVDLARGHGARTTSYSWNDDFAAARNAALAAVGPADWIVWLDADERLVCPEPADLLAELASSDAEVLAVQVRSSRNDGPDSVGLIGRFFRPHLRFDGALHEQLVRPDGSPPRIELLQHGYVEHLGYDAGKVDVGAKAERNLTVAQRAYDRSTTAKTALDYARSMALVARDPADVLAVLDVALDRAGETDPIHSAALSMASGVALGMGDVPRALAHAEATLDLEPGNDVAAVVIARTHSDPDNVVDRMLALMAASAPTLAVAENRVEALLRGARCAADVGRLDDGASLLRAAAELLTREAAVGYASLFSTTPEHIREDLLARLPGAARGLIRGLFAAPEGRAVDAEPPVDASMVERAGIGLPPDHGTLPCAPTLLAGMVYDGSRVLDFSGDAALGSLLDARAGSVHRLVPDEGLVAALESVAGDQARFDFVTGPLPLDGGRDVATQVLALLDPAGRALFWDLNADGFVVTESVRGMYEFLDRDLTTTAALPNMGFVSVPGAPNGMRLFRPSLDRIDIDASHAIGGSSNTSLTVRSPHPLPDHLQLGYRLSVPDTWAVRFESPEITSAEPTAQRHFTLITDADVFPDPAWVAALIEAAEAWAEPVGARLVGTDGRHVHAGLTDDGRSIGFGDPAAFPPLVADRASVRLAAPYLVVGSSEHAGAGGGGPAVHGRVVGSAVAFGTPAPDPQAAVASLAEVFGETVLFIGGDAPGRGDADRESAITKAAARLMDAGMTVVYQWDPDALPPDPRHLALWRSAGIVAVPPPDPALLSDQFLPDATAPRSDALALAFDPIGVVCLSRASVVSDFVLIADRAPAACAVYAGEDELGDLSDRLDHCLPVDAVADTVLEYRDRPPPPRAEVDIPAIAPVAAIGGLTSIVIPVYNRWDLTERCLATIAEHTPEPHEIVIVDNGSTDATHAQAGLLGCTVITNRENRGFPAAVNQGIESARGEFVCVLNNDTEVTAGWLAELRAALDTPGTELVGPRSNEITGLQRVPGAPSLDDDADAHRWAAEWSSAAGGRTWQIARLVGFCLLARRDTFERVGGFDQGFGIGNYEDDELGNRIQATGGALRVADGSVVLHHGSATFKELGLDYAAIMHLAARHLGTRTSEVTGVASALVLSDGSAEKAARAAVSGMYVADRVRIAERSAMLSAELAAAAVRGVHVEVLNADWTTDPGSEAAFDGLGGAVVVVVGANEQVVADDWGAVRAELETVSGSLAVAAPAGPETRVVAPVHGAIELVGTPSVHMARTFRLVPQGT